VPGLPLAVYVADCFGVVVHGDGVVGVAHAGWRGARSGVVSALLDAMRDSGHIPNRAVIGPGIRSCCFEVGPSVAAQFPDAVTETTWGGVSVDLPAVITAQLSEVEVDVVDGCTRHEEKYFSHRRDGLPNRQVALGWMR
jgi:copper oxidase (laccase) domain-containing protein